ncbi:hypothetical protein BVC80_1747g24 [Macleaya cordata]|uniref:Multipolar spindle 1 n=1 Tax=Macleaya cordata TaxID=56857 RepID=A0A200QKT8_MACCD|nr:hypothetical protein BVC80_1747g24 [Macleaya cordata]
MDSNPSLKFALAIALLRSKLLKNSSNPSSSSSSSESDAQRWKKKAKERKQEILRLKQELKELEDGTQYNLFPQIASCKCYFFDNLGKLSPRRVNLGDDRDSGFNDVLRRRFLRQVRLKERRKRPGESVRRPHVLELNVEDQIEQLSTSVDFLVDQCKTFAPVANDTSFTNWSHQAVDFILASLKNLLAKEKNQELVEGIVSRLITRLVGTMCIPSQKDESSSSGYDVEFYVQHLIRQLGSDPYIGQRTMLAVSQRISVLAESLLFMDPFDDAFPNTHSCMFVLIQLIEFLISDYTQTWTSNEGFERMLFEEWVRSVLQARKSLGLLECRNGLYVLYMDRVTGELANKVSEVSCLPTLSPDILENLFH